MPKKGVLSQIFEQKKTNSNGSFAIYIVPMRNPVLWKMHLKRDIPYRIYGGLSFIKERNQGCIVLLAIGYQPKDEKLWCV
jgi:hypothetical protein